MNVFLNFVLLTYAFVLRVSYSPTTLTVYVMMIISYNFYLFILFNKVVLTELEKVVCTVTITITDLLLLGAFASFTRVCLRHIGCTTSK
ncbi:hypothetical protein F5B20DRAFT_567022 [Whalleya microplaca]|nr:hypothetical protein F5B20DRAFT_567022 [Whalleya microplaca]